MSAIRPYLEYQADRVESTLAAHRAPARVVGGTVGPRIIRFHLQPSPATRVGAIERLADDLALALRVTALRVETGRDGVVLEFPRPDPRSVALRALLAEIGPQPVSTCVLGQQADGAPVLARLASPDVAHILIAGTTGSGKSVLLRAIAVSLLLGHQPELLGLLCLDPKGRTFAALAGAPHLVRPLITDPAEAAEALLSAVTLMEARDRRGETRPHLVILIDELADLILAGPETETALTRLLQRGREAGLHVVAATQRPSAAILSGVLRANFPLRLVGKVVSPEDARIAAGRGGSGAEKLVGQGDFIAVTVGGGLIRFQAAVADEHDEWALAGREPAGSSGAKSSAVVFPALSLPPTPPPEPEAALPQIVRDGVARLRPHWPELRSAWQNQEWGIKTRLIGLAWPGAPDGGSYTARLNQAIEQLEREIPTPTPTAAPIPTLKASNESESRSRNRSRNHYAHWRSTWKNAVTAS